MNSEMEWLTWSTQIERLLKVDEEDLQKIWRRPEEPELKSPLDFKQLQYHWQAPLYQKMIFRLRNCPPQGKGFYFWNQIDPINRSRLLNYFQMENCMQVENILNMLIWYFNSYFGKNDTAFFEEFGSPHSRGRILEAYRLEVEKGRKALKDF